MARANIATMAIAQIISVTTREIGPTGPITRLFAVAVDEPGLALEEVRKHMKPEETARWIDVRSLTLQPGEVRAL